MARPRTQPQSSPAERPVLHEDRSGLFDRGVLLATALNLTCTLASPAVGAFLPLYARDLGIGNIGLFYIIAGTTSILMRPILGRKSDSMGRGPSLALGFLSQLAGITLICLANGLPMIVLGGVFTSFGFALNGSATTALAMDLANPARRGKAMATFSVSFQLGAGVGAIIAGGLADLVGFRGMYAGAGLIVLCGLLLLLLTWKSLPRPLLAGAPA
jgi:MFS family permease